MAGGIRRYNLLRGRLKGERHVRRSGAGAIRSRLTLSFGERLGLEMQVAETVPSATGAVIVPQDVNLIMGEVRAIEDTRETAEEVLAAARGAKAHEPGTVLVAAERDGGALVLQAIVYDFRGVPPVKATHVFQALVAAFEEARRRRVERLALVPLGTAHAGLESRVFLKLLSQVCYTSAELGSSVRHVQLLVSSSAELLYYEDLLREQVHPQPRQAP